MFVASRVRDHAIHITIGQLLHLLFFGAITFEQNRVFDSVILANEIKACLVHVHDADGCVSESRELKSRQSDWTHADNQRVITGFGSATVIGMAANCQRFY